MAQPATVTIRGDASQFLQEMRRVRDETGRTATFIGRDLGGALRTLGTILGTGAFASFVRQAAQTADQLAKTADRLGVTTEGLQALRFAARGAGADIAVLDKALYEAQKRLANAATTGQGDAADWIKRLNLNARELIQLSPDQLFARYAESISQLSTRGEQFAAIQALMGKGTETLLNLIDGGRPALEQAKKDIHALGIELTRVDAKQIENANDALERLKAVTEGVGQRIAVAVAPYVEAFANSLVDSAKKQEDLNAKIESFARIVYFGFQIAANAAKLFDVAVSGVVAIVTTLDAEFLGAIRSIAEGAAGIAEKVGLDDLAANLQGAASAVGNVEGFVAAAAEHAQERVDTALAGIKSFEQIGLEADRIVAEAKARAAEQIANRPTGTGTEDTIGAAAGDEFDIGKFVEQEIERAQKREEIWTEFDRQFITNRIANETALAQERQRIEIQAEQAIQQQKQATSSYAIGLLQALGQKSKIFALASLALEKITTIQRVLAANAIAAELAFASQLVPGDPSSLARAAAAKAAVLAAGRVQAALIAATGVVQAINLFSEGGNAPGSPTNPIFTTPGAGQTEAPGAQSRGVTQVFINGFANEESLRALVEALEELDNRDVVVFSGSNAQSQVIREGG